MLNEKQNNIKNIFFQFKELNNRKNLIIIGVILIIIISAIGFCLFKSNKLGLFPSEQEKEPVSQEPPKSTMPDILYNLGGTVEALLDNVIVFEADIYQLDENNKLIQKKEIRKAEIDENTKFTYLTFIIHKETGKKIPEEVQMTLKDLKIGDYIDVSSDQNIKDKEEFKAIKVRFISHKK